MFVRPCWAPATAEELFGLIDANPWALLVTNGADGPFATRLPLLVDRTRGRHGTLVGHVARANDHAAALTGGSAPSLAVFEGPWSYVSASWYPRRQMPSTYYYTSVHCYGAVRRQTEAELETWLAALNDRMEPGLPDGWRLDEIPTSEITRRLPHIVGFELTIERIEGKFKLGQDEPRNDALAVADRLAAAPAPAHRSLADMIRRYNTNRPAAELE